MKVFDNYLVLTEKTNALPKLRIINRQTNDEHYIQFDEPAYLLASAENPELDTETLRYGYMSLTTPLSFYDYNMGTREQTLVKQQAVIGGHQPDEYVTERLTAPARDGKQIPISLVYKKGARQGANSPLLLYAYGSYGYATDPNFPKRTIELVG